MGPVMDGMGRGVPGCMAYGSRAAVGDGSVAGLAGTIEGPAAYCGRGVPGGCMYESPDTVLVYVTGRGPALATFTTVLKGLPAETCS